MASISRQLPNTNKTTVAAIKTAKTKLTSVLALDPTSTILRTETKADLNAIHLLIVPAEAARMAKKGALTDAVVEKVAARKNLYTHASHFIQIFNLRVSRGEATVGDRALLGLDVTTGKIPPTGKDQELKDVAQNLLTGETARIAAGKPAMTEVTLAELQGIFNTYSEKLDLVNAAKEAYDTAQETLTTHCNTARPIVKTIWDEVESKYTNETKDSIRGQMVLWGVIYNNVGVVPSKVTITTLEQGTNAIIEATAVRAENSDVEGFTEADGTVPLNCTFVGLETFTAEHPDYVPASATLTLEEGGEYVLTIFMVKVS